MKAAFSPIVYPPPPCLAQSPPPCLCCSPPARQVLLLVPTAGSRVLPLLSSNFPHKLRDRNTQCLYLRAAFALAEGHAGGAVREGVLAGVVEHLIGIDVEIRWAHVATGSAARCPQQVLPP